MKSLPILYHDEHLVAVNKPAGLLVHRTNLDRHATEFAMQILRNQLGKWVYPLHRLDKSASGILLFALDPETARRMTVSFTEKNVSKSYLAVVRGYAGETDRVDYPLRERWDKMTDQLVERDKPAQDAVTEFRRLAIVELPHAVGRYATARYSLVKANPLTGRKHQIRRHLKHIFHPIIGDTTHGDGKHNEFFRTQFNCGRLLLHAMELECSHPYADDRIRISAPLDDAFGQILDALHWDAAVMA